MTPQWLERTELLIGPDAIQRLQKAHVLVVGLGGVGSFAVEFLARSGVGTLTLVDGDVVDPTNRNRLLQALSSTHGLKKAALLEARVRRPSTRGRAGRPPRGAACQATPS